MEALCQAESQEPQAREKGLVTLTSCAGLKLLSIGSSNKRVQMGQIRERKTICSPLLYLTACIWWARWNRVGAKLLSRFMGSGGPVSIVFLKLVEKEGNRADAQKPHRFTSYHLTSYIFWNYLSKCELRRKRSSKNCLFLYLSGVGGLKIRYLLFFLILVRPKDWLMRGNSDDNLRNWIHHFLIAWLQVI